MNFICYWIAVSDKLATKSILHVLSEAKNITVQHADISVFYQECIWGVGNWRGRLMSYTDQPFSEKSSDNVLY